MKNTIVFDLQVKNFTFLDIFRHRYQKDENVRLPENKYACKSAQTVVRGNKKGTLRRFPQRVYVMNPIQYQRDGQHDGACADQNIGYGGRDADPEYMDKHGEIEQDRGCFAVPVCSKDRPCLVDDQDAGDAHEQFLEDHDDNQSFLW